MMTLMDWGIVLVATAGLLWLSMYTLKYVRSVSDFLSANRTAGRYAIAINMSVAGLGAISAIGFFEQYYAAGFPTVWWAWMIIPATMVFTLSGWVYYRFRETRCMTLAQFFEVRYSRRFRILTGLVIWLSGLINFGIFPFVTANFFVYFCGLPETMELFSVAFPTYWTIMLLTTGMAALMTVAGGQITILVTDCVQGIFATITLVVLIVFLLNQFQWSEIVDSLQEAPRVAAVEQADLKVLAAERSLERAGGDAAVQSVLDDAVAERQSLDDPAVLEEASQGQSMLNPFDTSKVKDFGVFFFLIMVFHLFYGSFSWQGSSAYRSSALTPHEQKMGSIISGFLYMIRLAGLVMLAVCALTFLIHPHFAELSAPAHESLELLKNGDTPQLFTQQRVPIALSYMLPAGLRGLFCVMMVFLLITTQDTYMHSWGTIFVQDVVMPFRKKPLTPKQHINLLRGSVVGVATFAIIFAALYKPTEYIQMYFAITGAIVAGMGAAIIGGLYWKRGSTPAAYAAVIAGSVLSVARIILMQPRCAEAIAAMPDKGFLFQFIHHLNTEVNSQIIWMWIMLVCIGLYVLLSLLGKGKSFNLERMLHRGRYDLGKGDHKEERPDAPQSFWGKLAGFGKEFNRMDRVIGGTMVAYNLVWIVLFVGAAAYNFLVNPIPISWWATFWKYWVYSQVLSGVLMGVWILVGGFRDIRRVFGLLSTMTRDDSDDGRVVHHHLPGEADEPGDIEA